ncbi:diphteria toxin resistance protein 2, dph2 [Dorcoceras hygrometricum]|uniref:Diphteria toxin resistance protein 2, dph2 n=1 Tax=Dorcoceras hygrometricum TaxID=472368 RepID=A0A2Z7BPK3_9LAMI|nr:diphteria toxin resistance protein 2, dph2 [Dorcoceras hygrometricum]
MLAGFTTEEAEADTVADQGLKRVNRIFRGLNEGIWPKTEELTLSVGRNVEEDDEHWNIEEDDESVDTSKSNADQLECHESAASSKESGTSDDNVISDVIVISRSSSRIAKSADDSADALCVNNQQLQDTSRKLQYIQSQDNQQKRKDPDATKEFSRSAKQ